MAIETPSEAAVLPILSHYINGTAVEVLPSRIVAMSFCEPRS